MEKTAEGKKKRTPKKAGKSVKNAAKKDDVAEISAADIQKAPVIKKSEEEKKAEAEKISEEINEAGLRKMLWVFAILAIIIVGSFAASYFIKHYNNQKAYDATHKEYNHFTFDKLGTIWKTTWVNGNQPYNLNMRHWPGELEDIPIEGKLNLLFNNTHDIYLTFDPESEDLNYQALTAGEVSLNINTALGRPVIAACLTNTTDGCSTRPIITCDDDDKAVIYLKVADDPKVTLDGNCMIIQGDQEGLVMAAERILYVWYGIMSR